MHRHGVLPGRRSGKGVIAEVRRKERPLCITTTICELMTVFQDLVGADNDVSPGHGPVRTSMSPAEKRYVNRLNFNALQIKSARDSL